MPKIVDHAERRAELTAVTARQIATVGIALAMVAYTLIGVVIILLAKPITRLAYSREG